MPVLSYCVAPDPTQILSEKSVQLRDERSPHLDLSHDNGPVVLVSSAWEAEVICLLKALCSLARLRPLLPLFCLVDLSLDGEDNQVP